MTFRSWRNQHITCYEIQIPEEALFHSG